MYPVIHLGRMIVPVFGVVLATGLVGALTLSLKTARRVGVDGDALWNVISVATVAVILISRALPVAGNWTAFKEYPVLVLTTPAVGALSVVLAAVIAAVYWRRVGLKMWRGLDALAACGALAIAFVWLGEFFAGKSWGWPATVAWSVTYRSAWASRFYGTPLGVAVHPVQVYGFLAWLALCSALVWVLGRGRQGDAFVAFLVVGGAVAFVLEMFVAHPVDALMLSGLDGMQWVSLMVMAVGTALIWRHGETIVRVEKESVVSDAV